MLSDPIPFPTFPKPRIACRANFLILHDPIASIAHRFKDLNRDLRPRVEEGFILSHYAEIHRLAIYQRELPLFSKLQRVLTRGFGKRSQFFEAIGVRRPISKFKILPLSHIFRKFSNR